MAFHSWLRSLSMMFSRFIRGVACVRVSVLFTAESFHPTDGPRSAHLSSVDGHWDCFYLPAMVNGAAVNVHMQGLEDLFSVFEEIGPEVPWSNLDSVFNVLRSGRNIFHSLCLFPLKLLSRYDFHKTKRSHLSVGLDDISRTVGL